MNDHDEQCEGRRRDGECEVLGRGELIVVAFVMLAALAMAAVVGWLLAK